VRRNARLSTRATTLNATNPAVTSNASARLSKSLKARHLAMISIGGIIGAGVFVGSSTAISQIGPAVVLSYLSAGIIVFAVIKILARMALDQPGLGAFTEYVRVALGDGAGFITGWMYWYFWVIVVGIEAIAGAKILSLWMPFEVWQIGLGLMAVLTMVNLASARSYGEFEFWFASIKVAAIIVFIVVAASWLLGWGAHGQSPGFTNLTAHQGFAPFGWAAIFAGMTTVIFSMCGAEIVTVAAAESAESGKTMSRLAASVVLRILLFYVLSILLILCVLPWTQIKSGDSPFAMTLQHIGIPSASLIMNIIVLTAVLSCLNSGVYVTARTLFVLADKGDAPRWLTTVNKRQVPARAILLGSAFGFIAMLISIGPTDNEFMSKLFSFLINASGAIMLIVYFFVAIAHFRFPYSAYAARNSGSPRVANFMAGGSAIAILIVLAAMTQIAGKPPELYASLGFLAVVIVSLVVKRMVKPHP
jgi:AAT family amino acid transporter/GABA permease